MSVLKDLQTKLEPGHTLKIIRNRDYEDENRKNLTVKQNIYTICIYHPDNPAGVFFSKYASHYSKIIEEVLDNHTNGKLYEGGCQEQGNDLQFKITWNKDRVLKENK